MSPGQTNTITIKVKESVTGNFFKGRLTDMAKSKCASRSQMDCYNCVKKNSYCNNDDECCSGNCDMDNNQCKGDHPGCTNTDFNTCTEQCYNDNYNGYRGSYATQSLANITDFSTCVDMVQENPDQNSNYIFPNAPYCNISVTENTVAPTVPHEAERMILCITHGSGDENVVINPVCESLVEEKYNQDEITRLVVQTCRVGTKVEYSDAAASIYGFQYSTPTLPQASPSQYVNTLKVVAAEFKWPGKGLSTRKGTISRRTRLGVWAAWQLSDEFKAQSW